MTPIPYRLPVPGPGFGSASPLARARCVVAEAETALAQRDLSPARGLVAAVVALDQSGDQLNAFLGRLLGVRRLVLLGCVSEATLQLADLDLERAPAALRAGFHLLAGELACRRVDAQGAATAFACAVAEASRAGIPALLAEVQSARATLSKIAARQMQGGDVQPLNLDQVEELLASDQLVVDGCRRVLRQGASRVSLGRRPVLFALLQALAQAYPAAATREQLLSAAFDVKRANESHRARLRVEIGRLRRLISDFAKLAATPGGFLLAPNRSVQVSVLLPPIDGEQASLLALLADGQPWSTSALAQALGESQRNVQRALALLEAEDRVHAVGRSRARRWLCAPLSGFTTTLLLPVRLSSG